jgi:hypothetical protein
VTPPSRAKSPDHEVVFKFEGRRWIALVWEIDPEFQVRDVTVFELGPHGEFRYEFLGFWGKRFAASTRKPFRAAVDRALRDAGVPSVV